MTTAQLLDGEIFQTISPGEGLSGFLRGHAKRITSGPGFDFPLAVDWAYSRLQQSKLNVEMYKFASMTSNSLFLAPKLCILVGLNNRDITRWPGDSPKLFGDSSLANHYPIGPEEGNLYFFYTCCL